MIEIKRKVKKEIEETVMIDLQPYWVIRIIRTNCYNVKECVAEVECETEPRESDIADALAKYVDRKVFASVAKNYRFAEIKEQKND